MENLWLMDADGKNRRAITSGKDAYVRSAYYHKNRDGKLSRQEHAAAPEHANEKAATGGTSGGTKSKY